MSRWHLLVLVYPLLAMGGAVSGSLVPLYGLIVAIAAAMALGALGRIPDRVKPALLYAIGVSLIWQTTLKFPHLVGSDIHLEYRYALLTQQSGSWDYSLPFAYNSCLPVTFLAPLAARFLGIETAAIIRVAFPAIFALVAPLLYLLYRPRFGATRAFLAVCFFLVMPVFSLEIPALARQMVGEPALLLACMILIGVAPLSPSRPWLRAVVLIGAVLLVVLAHYTMWIILCAVFIGLLLWALITRVVTQLGWPLLSPPSWRFAAVGLLVSISIGWLYYGAVCSGETLRQILARSPVAIPTSEVAITLDPTSGGFPLSLPTGGDDTRYEPLLRSALGLDIGSCTPAGAVFRVVQILTQLLLLIGLAAWAFNYLRRRGSPDADYMGLSLPMAALLGACVLVPGFSAHINATRFYHLGLLFLAPAVIHGGEVLFMRIVPRRHPLVVLSVAILLPYFAFTSGAVFELLQSPSVDRNHVPYCVALSDPRLDLSGSFTADDARVRDWAFEQGYAPAMSDLHGATWLLERYRYEDVVCLPPDLTTVQDDSVIFIRSRSNQEQVLTYWTGVGLRQAVPMEDVGLAPFLSRRPILYSSGDAILYGPAEPYKGA